MTDLKQQIETRIKEFQDEQFKIYVGVSDRDEKGIESNFDQKVDEIRFTWLYDQIKFLQSLLPLIPTWVSVEERLPELGKRVLCSSIYGVQIGWRTVKGDWQFCNDGSQFTLQHWQPLPEIPNAEKMEGL